MKMRMTIATCVTGALVFLGGMIFGGALDATVIVRSLVIALIGALAIRGLLSWVHSPTDAAIESLTEAFVHANQGEGHAAVADSVKTNLPELGHALEGFLTHSQKALKSVQTQALVDEVTGLPNRISFCSQVERCLKNRERDKIAALFFIDLDGFKNVNDTLGHAAGDSLLARVAMRLRDVAAAQKSEVGEAIVGRFAGDEFTMFFSTLPDRRLAQHIARAIQIALGARFDLGSQYADLGASVGIACYPEHGATLDDLLRSADIAMYHAKHKGRGRAEMFTANMALQAADRAELERDLHLALEREEFLLEFQPQIEIESGHATVAEALLRWVHPERDLIMPGYFVPVAKESGAIVALGEWVMNMVCSVASRWAAAGIRQRISMNISNRELGQSDFFERFRRVMATHNTPPTMLELEISESLAMEMDMGLLNQLASLRHDGVRITIDDFGTGYSNLSRLRALPVDRVKIDRSLIRDIATSADTRTICSAVVGLIQSLGLEVVAEGVETQAQIEILRIIGCSQFQGYHLAHPMRENDYINRYVAPIKIQPFQAKAFN